MELKTLGFVLTVILMAGGCHQTGVVKPAPEALAPTIAQEVQPTAEMASTEEIYLAETVFIPAGSFLMGAEAETGFAICEESRAGCALEDFADEGPVREVTLDAFWIDKFEVTNNGYRRCVDAGGCDLPALLEFYNHPDFADHPVVYVSWFQAERFCQWAGGSLPTEAQWELAARGRDGRIFPWGDALVCGKANLKGCTQGLTMPAGSFVDGASPYGVMDMAGNAAEWTADWYDPAGYDAADLTNPTGLMEGELKTARGGSWKNPFSGARATNRTANYPEVFSSGVGFRCVYQQQP